MYMSGYIIQFMVCPMVNSVPLLEDCIISKHLHHDASGASELESSLKGHEHLHYDLAQPMAHKRGCIDSAMPTAMSGEVLHQHRR